MVNLNSYIFLKIFIGQLIHFNQVIFNHLIFIFTKNLYTHVLIWQICETYIYCLFVNLAHFEQLLTIEIMKSEPK